MNLRPSLFGHVNCAEVCDCGEPKDIHKQWCEGCWDKIPIKVARNYQQRCLALARQIITCNRFIKEYEKSLNKPQPEVTESETAKV